jgi:hypothetical protein
MKLIAAILFALAASNANDPSALMRRSANYTVSLRLPASGLFAGDEMQIEFRVADATQIDPVMGAAPIIRARIDSQIDMPEMPSMPKIIETAHPEGVPGDYGIHPTFPHGGAYRLRLNVHPPAGEAFHVEFPLEIQDAGKVTSRALPPRFRLLLTTEPKSLKSGETTRLRFEVRERENPKAIYSSFETVHEKLMHLIIVSKDLRYFRHVHPEITAGGAFVLSHTFPHGGDYHLFADVAPRGAGSQVMFVKLKVGGRAGRDERTSEDLSLKASAGGAVVEIAPDQHPIVHGKTKVVPVVFRNPADATPVVDLENYLGAKAHLILIHEDALTFVHSHPDEREASAVKGIVPFLVRLPKPGVYRAWLQFMRAGSLETARFEVSAGSK